MSDRPTVGVIGAGLIGGSVARAASHAGYPVLVYDIRDDIRESLILAGLGVAHTIEALARRAEIIVLAVPPSQIDSVLTELNPHLHAGQILTDVSSTKVSPTTTLATAPSGVTVVGGHPLAGSEKSGWENSTRDLFEDCVWVLCPADGEIVPSALTRMIVAVGAAQILVCSAEEHDRAVASISHGVQAASTAIASAIGSVVAEDRLPWLLAAGGWRDTTRIAESDAEMWAPIMIENANNLVPVLTEMIERMSLMRAAVETANAERVRTLILEGNMAREAWKNARTPTADQ